MREQRIVLENGIDIPFPGRQIAGLFTKNFNCAARELFEASYQTQTGGFAGAGWPQHRKKFTIINRNTDPIDCTNIPVKS